MTSHESTSPNNPSSGSQSTNWRTGKPSTPSPQPASNTLNPQTVQSGLIALFKLTNLPPTSIIHTQPWVNQGADHHPVCIIGLQDHGQRAICLQMTSFDGKTIDQKYSDAHEATRAPARRLYAPVLAPNHPNYPAKNAVVLQLASGQMNKLSYVNTQAWFTIETANLLVYQTGGIRLSSQSVDELHGLVRDLLDGTTRIFEKTPGRPIMPLHVRPNWTAAELGIPSGRTPLRPLTNLNKTRTGLPTPSPTPPRDVRPSSPAPAPKPSAEKYVPGAFRRKAALGEGVVVGKTKKRVSLGEDEPPRKRVTSGEGRK